MGDVVTKESIIYRTCTVLVGSVDCRDYEINEYTLQINVGLLVFTTCKAAETI